MNNFFDGKSVCKYYIIRPVYNFHFIFDLFTIPF